MRFGILGPLEVADGQRLVELGGPRQRTLLAMLLVRANRVVSTDALIHGIWGDEPPARVVTGLQVLVSNLRRCLEPDRPVREAPRMLMTRPPGYILAIDPGDLDAARFEERLALGRGLLERGDPAAAHRTLSEALALWRGPALCEVAGEDFARPAAVRLNELRNVAAEDRIQAALDQGRHPQAVPELERLVLEDPLRERLWGLLMLAYYRSGRQADALRTYQQARERLREELGIDPGPALQRLEADVLAQAPNLDWRPTRTEARPVAPEPEPARTGGLVAREAELARLTGALADAGSGRGQLVLVSGGPGVGKTRLLDELTRRAAAEGTVVAWGRCHEGDSAPPFWPWLQLLRGITQAGAVDPAAPALNPFVPELQPDAEPAAGALAEAANARAQVFQGLATFLVGLAGSRRLVLVVDDLQWADAPSLELFAFLASQLSESRLLLLGTWREDEVGASHGVRATQAAHPLGAALASLARHPWTDRLRLDGLDASAVALLVASVSGTPPTPAVASGLHARTDGNPFFVLELVRMAGGDAAAALKSPVPLGVQDVVRQRIAQLPPEAATVLTVATVAGREFDDALLDAATDLDEDAVLTAVELAVDRGVLTEVAGAVGRYRFAHGLIQESLYEGLGAVRRARLHARVAAALEARTTGSLATRAADLAHHFWHAGAAGDPAKAVRYAVEAADRAVEQLAYERAQELLERALTLAPSVPDPDLAELAVQTRRGRLLAALQGHATPDARAAFARARDLCTAAGEAAPGHEQVAARWGLFYALYIGGDLAGAGQVAHELLALAESGAVPAAATAGHLAVGIAAFHVGSLAVAYAHLSAVPATSDPEMDAAFQVDPRVYARSFLSLVLGLFGRREEADAVAAEAHVLADGLGQPFTAATAAMFRAWLAFLVDDPAAARAHGADAANLAEFHGFLLLGAAAQVFEGWGWAHTDPASGAALARKAVDQFEARSAIQGNLLFRIAQAEAELLDGRADEALDALRALVERRRRAGGSHYFDADLHRRYGELLLADGAADESSEQLRRAVEVAHAQGARSLEERAAASLAAAEARKAAVSGR